MTHVAARQSDEFVAPLTPTSRDGQRALIEHLAQACVGSPQSPRRTASDTTRGTTVPLLYTELYHGNGFGHGMSPTKMASGSDTHTNGSSYKHRAASTPDLEPLQEIDSSLSLSSDSSKHDLSFHEDPPMTPSHAVISRKERNDLQLPSPAKLVTFDVGKSSGNGTVGKYADHGTSGRVTGSRSEPFDPQRAYPSEACIFVANLLESAPDEKLAEALTVVFGHYGTVFIKIKRKATNMPYAFVQYTNGNDARAAIQGARGARILDRVCRMEPANSKRFWLVRRGDGKPTSVAEVQQAIAGLGAARIQVAQDSILEALGIDDGIRVEFPQWDQSRDLRRSIGSQFVAEPLDEFALTRRQQNTAAAQVRIGRKINGDGADQNGTNGAKVGVGDKVSNPVEAPSRWGSFMDRYDRDRRSVFCGNLPSNIVESELRQVFGKVGDTVKSVEIIRCPHSAYAFIEFSRADICETVMDHLNGSHLRGMNMKVERKRARVPNSAANPAQQQRFASMPHRGGGGIPQREARNFTRLPLPHQGENENGVEIKTEQNQNGGGRPELNGTVTGPSSPSAEAAVQGQNGGTFSQHHAQYLSYLQYLHNAHHHTQALQAAQAQYANEQQSQGSSRGLQDLPAQGGSQSPEHSNPALGTGLGLGAGSPPFFNPFVVPYPFLSQNGAMLPGAVPFGGVPYTGAPLSPTYPISPGHLLGVGNPLSPGIPAAGSPGMPVAGSPVNAGDHPFGPPPNVGHAVGPGHTLAVGSTHPSGPGLMAGSPVSGGEYPLGPSQNDGPGHVSGMASYSIAQGSMQGQNGIHHPINGRHTPAPPGLAPPSGLHGGWGHALH